MHDLVVVHVELEIVQTGQVGGGRRRRLRAAEHWVSDDGGAFHLRATSPYNKVTNTQLVGYKVYSSPGNLVDLQTRGHSGQYRL